MESPLVDGNGFLEKNPVPSDFFNCLARLRAFLGLAFVAICIDARENGQSRKETEYPKG